MKDDAVGRDGRFRLSPYNINEPCFQYIESRQASMSKCKPVHGHPCYLELSLDPERSLCPSAADIAVMSTASVCTAPVLVPPLTRGDGATAEGCGSRTESSAPRLFAQLYHRTKLLAAVAVAAAEVAVVAARLHAP